LTNNSSKFDIIIVGAGVIGVVTAFWISELYKCKIAIIDKETKVAQHATFRNTGVIHRPFYLNPEKKRIFAKSTQKSYHMWKKLATIYNLPWNQVETLEVALNENDLPILEQYLEWGIQNQIPEKELSLLDGTTVKTLEPKVECAGALLCKTDTSVNFEWFTKSIFSLAVENGVTLLRGKEVTNITEKNSQIELKIKDTEGTSHLSCDLLINNAGGGAVNIAHSLDLAKKYTDLNFRGNYWKVEEPFASKIKRNIYSIPKDTAYPFLDPHFIVKFDGTREIGPSAALVFSPNAYKGLSETTTQFVKKIFERPLIPKIKLTTNKKFQSMVWHEWRITISKKALSQKMNRFIPTLKPTMLKTRGVAGVRSQLIDENGFLPEPIIIESPHTIHLLNYNSPGATGAPAFSAHLVSQIQEKGHFDNLTIQKTQRHNRLWNFEKAKDYGKDKINFQEK
jgi:L-2-hydroxyglutarate oxidase|tara:strand:+ start:656 stop:2011 length:1356 start_codon:yes stop_codon:yes gene_type:complete